MLGYVALTGLEDIEYLRIKMGNYNLFFTPLKIHFLKEVRCNRPLAELGPN